MKKIFFIMLFVALIGFYPAASPANSGKPYCGGGQSEFTFGAITITTPKNNATTAACGDCVDKITITGIPAGAIVEGRAIVSEVFSNATTGPNVCGAAGPRYSYFPGTANKFWTPDRNVISVVPLNCSGSATCSFILDYPPPGEWHTPELHVDFQITVFIDVNGNGTYDQWGSSPDTTLVGPYFGGTGGWDPVCGSTGCTPGYWKNHDFPIGVDPIALVNTVFGITNGVNSNLTLVQALALKGGGESAFLRQAVAAYLSAIDPGPGWCYNRTVESSCTIGGCAYCWIGFPYYPQNPGWVDGVKDIVQDAYAANQFEDFKNLFAAANETQCALDDYPRWFGPCCTDLDRFCDWWLDNSVP
jgi:hypothetical protein